MIFLSNELINPEFLRKLNMPIRFINFALLRGSMFTFGKLTKSVFSVFNVLEKDRKLLGNRAVYGALFHLDHEEIYLHHLDAIHDCSFHLLKSNNVMDNHHRITTEISPIHFKTLDDLRRLKYYEGDSIKAWCYVGNLTKPRIKSRLRIYHFNHRVTDGILPEAFRKLFWEVNK